MADNQSGEEHKAIAPWPDAGMLDQVDIALIAVGVDGTCRRFNRAAERLFGYTQQNMLGQDMHAMLHSRRPDGSPFPSHDCEIFQAIRSGLPLANTRQTMWSRAGEALPVDCTVAPLQVEGEKGAVITAKDLRAQVIAEASLHTLQAETTELLRQRDAASRMERELAAAESIRQRELATQVEQTATAKLREQQELLDSVVQTTPVGIAVLDEQLRFRWFNPAYAAMMRGAGVPSPANALPFLNVMPVNGETEPMLREVQRTGKPFVVSALPHDAVASGRTYWNWSVKRLPAMELLVTVQNVTEQTMSHQALVESDKMAAVGRLAASISHEINNPLEAVTNLLYLVQSDPDLSAESRGYIRTAEEELSRVSRIASETLRFHRHAVEAVQRTPKQLVDPVLALYAGKLKSTHVRVTVDFGEGEPVMTFEGDVRQILNNLVGNAIDAMQRGGHLYVRTRSTHCVRTGRRGVRISVSDTGHGMSRETAARIFEPFYTTKGAAGSGLGLWISNTLAERHGGRLAVRSCREGNAWGRPAGTTFSLFIPNHSAAVASATLQ